MSQEDAEIVRRAFDASRLDDREAFLDMCATDIVWNMSRSPFPEARV